MILFDGRTKSPCHGCKNRSAECHAKCEDYLQFVKDRTEERGIIHKYMKEEKVMIYGRSDQQFKNALNRSNKNRVFKGTKK